LPQEHLYCLPFFTFGKEDLTTLQMFKFVHSLGNYAIHDNKNIVLPARCIRWLCCQRCPTVRRSHAGIAV